MSWEPLGRWALRCDGELALSGTGSTSGRCTSVWEIREDDEPGTLVEFDEQALNGRDLGELAASGWIAYPDGPVLCPTCAAARLAALEAQLTAATTGQAAAATERRRHRR